MVFIEIINELLFRNIVSDIRDITDRIEDH